MIPKKIYYCFKVSRNIDGYNIIKTLKKCLNRDKFCLDIKTHKKYFGINLKPAITYKKTDKTSSLQDYKNHLKNQLTIGDIIKQKIKGVKK